MNREQRRRAAREKGTIVNIPVKDLVLPTQLTRNEARLISAYRMEDNIKAAGHPLHHKTENGAIVEPDPTLEVMLSKLDAQEQESLKAKWMKEAKPNAPKAIPVNRKFYGYDTYERH